jgi:hypothetical protein
MTARAAIALLLAALAWAADARAEDDPACAQYREPISYNACLARHGPKANNVGKRSGQSELGGFRNARAYGRAPTTRSYGTRGAQRVHGRMHMEFQVR